MKITKRQLKRIIKEEKTKILNEGNHAIDYMIGYEDAMADLPQNSDDPWYNAGYADYLEGKHEDYELLAREQAGEDIAPLQVPPIVESKIKSKIRSIVNEMMGYQGKPKSYNQASDAMKAQARRAKRIFAKDYPKIQVKIDGRNGWIIVDGKKAANISSASGRPMSIDDMIDKMKQAYLGH
tara:strand:+ start:526 stop:1068 length:543 start_codon:yes stop_codon:yes gene_type:complete